MPRLGSQFGVGMPGSWSLRQSRRRIATSSGRLGGSGKNWDGSSKVTRAMMPASGGVVSANGLHTRSDTPISAVVRSCHRDDPPG
jgi:hypothetical protein